MPKNKQDSSLKTFSNVRWLLDIVLVFLGIFAFFLMVALVSFSPFDPSWLHAACHGPIHNLGGVAGAWFADTLFFALGVLAYVLPPIVFFFCWDVLFTQSYKRVYINLFSLSLQFIGGLMLLLSSCCLAALNVDDKYYFTAGGVIGSLLSSAIFPWFNNVIGASIAMLCIWASGLTLFTRWSWVTISEKIGAVVLDCFTVISNGLFRNECDQEDKNDPKKEDAARRNEAVLNGHNIGGTQTIRLSNLRALATEDDEPYMCRCQRDLEVPYCSYHCTVLQYNNDMFLTSDDVGQKNSNTPLTFMPAPSVTRNCDNLKLKQGIKSNPMLISTRLKFFSWENNIPSQPQLAKAMKDICHKTDCAAEKKVLCTPFLYAER
ncbi:DNA translocase FtsK 4TM domain-containing protein [Sodalis endosymbiont of Henestaris halophilus]|uniref:DNA translocase FtsK 4TM domain-containing protein n=1 Tax=Sodalis endosymbiont of Henestaris halophilus TaxID=1929246 RepID=UPI000BC09A1E|nr:DNA translocase FtsK 4TM domain-containing protein [Sodalis endosymbiont of Henestaris halophilus]SNC59142.1 DNA translocase FtsK [Sodalis endosymbiont of Henestaris halophilus]